MKNIKIFISCHKKVNFIKNSILQPIQVGCALNNDRYKDMLSDNIGDNISQLNPMYCELTAQYWAWKNIDTDYYGFCHYRRYFNFSKNEYAENIFGVVEEKFLNRKAIAKYGFDENSIQELVEKYDVIIPKINNLHKVGERNVFSQYEDAKFLHGEDIHTIYEIVKKLYPEFEKYSSEYLNGSDSIFCNMFIMKKDIFFHYCQWLFPILSEFCKCTDMHKYSTDALRTPGHLSERLLGIYITYLKNKYKNLRIKELQCVYFESTESTEYLKPAFKERSIPVVFAANDAFVPMLSACMQSIIEHYDINYNYDFVVLHTNISETNRKELLRMVKSFTNLSLRFFNVDFLIYDYNLKANAHISVETYYRFLIQEVLQGYDKILYLDCDLIANYDITELYKTNIDGYLLAAARDPDFLGQINGANHNTQKYCRDQFHMKDPYNYFQAGVLLFNNKEMKKAHSLEEWLTYASHKYLYNDQDVLNLYCEGKIKYLDMSWNMITDCAHTRVKEVISYAPSYIQEEYKKAHSNPKLIHYAGFMKPWFNPTEDYAHYFWYYLRKTPFYEELIYKMYQRASKSGDNIKPNIRKIIDLFLPKGTRRRELVKKLVGRNVAARI